MSLVMFDTLENKKRPFEPLEPGKVKLYVCGVTVYDLSHVGHARCYIAFDVIQKWLRKNYEVTFVRNFTDIDDKIIRRANELGEEPIALAARYIDEYHRDMQSLGVAKADIEPKVSTHLSEIVKLVETLIAKGYAYRVPSTSSVEGAGDDVFYRVDRFEGYTELSRKDLGDLQSGARVDVDTRKESPLDFALWKSAKPDEPSWDSPFGKGRPGWHIECSAMSQAHLGDTMDIHGGGKDLVFPHHTNEIAQSEAACGEKYARYWLHNGFVNVRDESKCPVTGTYICEAPEADVVKVSHNEEEFLCANEAAAQRFRESPETYLKMSKSLGNFFTIREVLKEYSADALRWLMVGTHYRSPIQFSERLLDKAEARVQYMYQTLADVEDFLGANVPREGASLAQTFGRDTKDYRPLVEFAEAMNDDFNTPEGMRVLNELFKIANLMLSSREKEWTGQKLKAADRARLLLEWKSVVGELQAVLGLGLREPRETLIAQRAMRSKKRGIDTALVRAKLEARHEARSAKDFSKSDEIRDELLEIGVVIKDGIGGTDWCIADAS